MNDTTSLPIDERERYAHAWRAMRRRAWASLLLLLFCAMALTLSVVLGAEAWILPGLVFSAAAISGINLGYFFYPCPRCRRPFTVNMARGVLTEYPNRLEPGTSHTSFLTPFSSHCRHCGLPRNALPADSPRSAQG